MRRVTVAVPMPTNSYVATEDRTYYKAIKLISGPIGVGDKVRRC